MGAGGAPPVRGQGLSHPTSSCLRHSRIDPDALRRDRAVRRTDAQRSPAAVRLADAQLAIAREYGFPSWPKLVAYFDTRHRHERSGPRSGSRDRRHYEREVRAILASHRQSLADSPLTMHGGTGRCSSSQ